MLSYDEAIKLVLDNISPLPAVEKPLDEACGLVLAEDINARWDMPPADNSSMDGFTFAFDACSAASTIPVAGHSYAGHPFGQEVPAGSAVRIMTGAPIPAGCDTVVPFEEVEQTDETIQLRKDCKVGQYIRPGGGEFRSGDPILQAGTCLRAGEIGLLAAAGFARVHVHPAPRVAILSTGDELVDLGQRPGPGQIVNSNMHLLMARLSEAGAEVIPLGIAPDDESGLDQCLCSGLQADLLLTSGGVSVGDKDQVQDAFVRHGFKKIFWRVAIKPGKPVLFGKIGSQPVFGLPGNPASSAATCELFTIPALRRLAGHKDPLPARLKVRLAAPVKGDRERQTFIWGSLEAETDGYRFNPSNRQDSGQNRSLLGASALLPVPPASPELKTGEQVEALLFRLPRGSAVY
jgi:molybdopterin molybdotransferase